MWKMLFLSGRFYFDTQAKNTDEATDYKLVT